MKVEGGANYPFLLDELPKGWASAYVGDFIPEIDSGFPCGRHNSSGDGVVHLRPYNIGRDGNLDLSEFKFVPEDSGLQRVRNGDVLFNNTNSPELIGKTTTVVGAGDWAFSNHMTRLRIPEGIKAKFVALQLHYLWVVGYFRGRCTNHVNQASISSSTLARTVPLLMAPEPEQQKIIEAIETLLSDLDAAIAALKRVQANLKRYRASVLKAACEGQLEPTEAHLAREEGHPYESGEELLKRILVERRAKSEADQLARMVAAGKPPNNDDWKKKYKEPEPADATKLPALPDGWTWARAEQVCDFITKGTTPSAAKLHAGEGEVPFVKVYNLTDRGVLDFSVNPTFIDRSTHETELARSKVVPGDVLMNIVGPPLGKVSLVPDGYPEWNINQAIAIFRPLTGLNRRYLMYLLLCDEVLRRAVLAAKATAGQFNLTLEICRDLPLPIPPVTEQIRVAAELDSRISSTEAAEDTCTNAVYRADRLRQSILKRAFEGKLVPQDPNDEPASMLLERIRAARSKPDEPIRRRKQVTATHA